jgi:hypothetical protein
LLKFARIAHRYGGVMLFRSQLLLLASAALLTSPSYAAEIEPLIGEWVRQGLPCSVLQTREDEGVLWIRRDAIEFYESMCEVRIVTRQGARFLIDGVCYGEGESWADTLAATLVDDDTLEVNGVAWTRCTKDGEASAPAYELDASQSHVTALSNLYPDPECHPAEISGRVVHREFDEEGIAVTGVTIEESSGERLLANVEVDVKSIDRVRAGWIVQGLQTLLKEGSNVSLGVRLCGASGRVVMVDAVHPAQ